MQTGSGRAAFDAEPVDGGWSKHFSPDELQRVSRSIGSQLQPLERRAGCRRVRGGSQGAPTPGSEPQ